MSKPTNAANAPIDLARYAREFPSLQFLAPEPGILELVMSNKGRLNAATEAMHRDLALVWRTVDMDDAVRVVVVRGEGSNFSSGGDFDMIHRMIEDEATLIRVWKEASDLVYNLINCSKPVVSAIRGSAVGAGLAIALLADVSVAADNARILDGHTRLGVAAGDHAVIIWPLLCGLAKARYHLLTNKSLSGAEAERIGLVAVAVPDAQVLDTAFETARALAASSATAIRWTKHALNNWLRMAGPSFDTSLALEFLGFKLSDVREGLAAAREKRRPAFDRPAPDGHAVDKDKSE
jgi:enoyl-CoA hydratase